MLNRDLTNIMAFTWEAMGLLDRTLRRVKRESILLPIEQKLEAALEEAFFRQGEVYISMLKELKPWFPAEQIKEAYIPTSLSDAALLALWEAVMAGTWYYFEDPMNAAAVASMLAGKTAAIVELQWTGGFALGFDEALLNQIPALTKMQLHSINRTTQKYINTQIRHAMDEGWSYDRTAKAISDRFEEFAIGKPQLHIQSRAHLVAVTETGNLYTEANFQTAKTIQGMGLRIEKYWANVGDDRVSKGCLANTADKWIPLDDKFTSGHLKPLRFPGCRCDLYTRRAKGQPAEVAKKPTPKKALRAENGEAETDKAIREIMLSKPDATVTQHSSSPDRWVDHEARQKAKHELITELSKRTGMPYERVDEAIKQWARSSNADMRSLGFQQAASEEFGVPLSQWQQDKIIMYQERVRGYGLGGWPIEEIQASYPGYFPLMPMEGMRALVRAQYEYTQELFKQHGIKELTLYRGVSASFVGGEVPFEEFDKIAIDMNTASSWSMMSSTADDFAGAPEGDFGYTAQATVPVERILATARTGWGCLSEFEVIVLGSAEEDIALIWDIFT